ncbi:hypothetical protein GCM10017044_03870 [Kordiimonas sediminis]|uniref:Tetratricopeptide repeat protein n=1 Tax=Kordiimonas sediminis TaxID=1735581 RepID=A0A919E4T6_9PROT|nr:tetratricopeptide repeat protein [Kordiimonas sediminis]GHF13114.1 hypothetical protein GCM10017044_03870 [Kordiimonas sediminis]
MRAKSILYGFVSLAMTATPAYAYTYDIVLQPSELINKGNYLVQIGESEQARDLYYRALKSSLSFNQEARVYNSLCATYIMDEDWDDALENCNRAIKMVPNNWRFYNNRGNIYLEIGDVERAMEEYKRGLKLAPQSQTIQYNIALAKTRAETKGYDGA